MRCLMPRSPNFEVLRKSVEDILDKQFTESFLTDLQERRVNVHDLDQALSSLPPLGNAFGKGQVFESPPLAWAKLDDFEKELIRIRYRQVIEQLKKDQPEAVERFAPVFENL